MWSTGPAGREFALTQQAAYPGNELPYRKRARDVYIAPGFQALGLFERATITKDNQRCRRNPAKERDKLRQRDSLEALGQYHSTRVRVQHRDEPLSHPGNLYHAKPFDGQNNRYQPALLGIAINDGNNLPHALHRRGGSVKEG
jgi:hypothetical protein